MAVRALAWRQRTLDNSSARIAPLPSQLGIPALREPKLLTRIGFALPFERAKPMRWKISHHGHDPRQIDLIAILALLIIIVAAFRFYSASTVAPPNRATFIVPSQSVHW